jgi:hypothetical protein
MAATKKQGGRSVRLYGLTSSPPMFEGTLADGVTCADIVRAFNSRRWRLDDADGRVLCGPDGVRAELDDPPASAAEESTASSRVADAEG